MTIYTLALLMV